MGFLQRENNTVLDLSVQIPNFNSIENIWKIIGERALNRNSKDPDEL